MTVRAAPIVVGVDDSSASREAVVYAAWEAERRGLALRLVHGYLVPTPLAPLFDVSAVLASAQELLARTAQVVRSRRPDLLLATRAVAASGGPALIEESASAGLVVVGSPHVRGFAGAPIGSVTSQVLAASRCPVLVVPRSTVVPSPIPGTGPVLVGIDAGAGSKSPLGFGFDEAAARGVSVVAVHVWSAPELSGLSAIGAGAVRDRDPAHQQLQEAAERTLAEAVAEWQERYPQITLRRWVVHSFGTARVLLDVAREVSAGLLVVGSYERTDGSGAVLGSVSQTLISHAVTPVAVIGPQACARPGMRLTPRCAL